MNKPSALITALLLSVSSALSMAQPVSHGDDKTLLLTLKFQQDAFHVVNLRLLNEHLPKRATYISSHDDLSFSARSLASEPSENVESHVLSQVLEQANHNPKYTAYRVEGASIIVRHPYQSKSSASFNALSSPQIFNYGNNTKMADNSHDQIAENPETKREPNSLPNQLMLSPSIDGNEEKKIYSDLL